VQPAAGTEDGGITVTYIATNNVDIVNKLQHLDAVPKRCWFEWRGLEAHENEQYTCYIRTSVDKRGSVGNTTITKWFKEAGLQITLIDPMGINKWVRVWFEVDNVWKE